MPICRGEIYFVNLNPVKGREQAGSRPVLVLSIDAINKLPLVVTVVVGTKGKNISRNYPTNVRLSPKESGLPEETVFLCFQIRSLDPKPAEPEPNRAAALVNSNKFSAIKNTNIILKRLNDFQTNLLAKFQENY